MGQLTKRQKEAKKRQVPDYIPTDDERRWHEHCSRLNIRISPVALLDNAPGKWQIGISIPDNYKKIYRSPEICDKDTLWEVFYR